MRNKIIIAFAALASLFLPGLVMAQGVTPPPAACEVYMLQIDEGMESVGAHKDRTWVTKPEIDTITAALLEAGLRLPEEYKQADQVSGYVDPEAGYGAIFFGKGGCALIGGKIPLSLYVHIRKQIVAQQGS